MKIGIPGSDIEGRTEKVALVTGANRGIGLETCRQLLQRGYLVILTARDPQRGVKAIEGLGRPSALKFFKLDVTDPEDITAIRTNVEREYGRLDALVNNAGVLLDEKHSVLDVPMEDLRTTLETNSLGALLLARAFIPMMISQKYGRIVNVSSGMGEVGDQNDYAPSYRLSKLLINGITLILDDSVKGKNILVNSVCPGWVRTDMGGPGASRSLEVGASGIVWAATLPDDGPGGGFFRDGKAIAW